MTNYSIIQKIYFVLLCTMYINCSQQNDSTTTKTIHLSSGKRYAFMPGFCMQPHRAMKPITFSLSKPHNHQISIQTVQKALFQPVQSNHIWVLSPEFAHYTPYRHLGIIQADRGQFVDVYEQVDQAPLHGNIRTLNITVYSYQHQQDAL